VVGLYYKIFQLLYTRICHKKIIQTFVYNKKHILRIYELVWHIFNLQKFKCLHQVKQLVHRRASCIKR
jgi:hypothetical protein